MNELVSPFRFRASIPFVANRTILCSHCKHLQPHSYSLYLPLISLSFFGEELHYRMLFLAVFFRLLSSDRRVRAARFRTKKSFSPGARKMLLAFLNTWILTPRDMDSRSDCHFSHQILFEG